MNFNTYKDSELLVLLKQQRSESEKAFEVIWGRYSSPLLYFCQYNAKNQNEAEDLFQETWVRFYNNARKERDIGSIKLYLFKIAYNLLKKIKDESENNADTDLGIVTDTDDSFDIDKVADEVNFIEQFEYEDIVAQFNIALNYLDPEAKESVLLHWVGGFSFSEISIITGESQASIRMRSVRAMEKAIKYISPNFKNNNNR